MSSTAHTSKPDYSAIVTDAAAKLGARVYEVISEQAADNAPPFELRAIGMKLREGSAAEAAWSDLAKRELFVELPVASELGCVIAMHELGHIATSPLAESCPHPGGWTAAEIADHEATASLWALDHLGFTPSRETKAAILDAFHSYLEAAPDDGSHLYGPHPLLHVKRDSPGWKLENRCAWTRDAWQAHAAKGAHVAAVVGAHMDGGAMLGGVIGYFELANGAVVGILCIVGFLVIVARDVRRKTRDAAAKLEADAKRDL